MVDGGPLMCVCLGRVLALLSTISAHGALDIMYSAVQIANLQDGHAHKTFINVKGHVVFLMRNIYLMPM